MHVHPPTPPPVAPAHYRRKFLPLLKRRRNAPPNVLKYAVGPHQPEHVRAQRLPQQRHTQLWPPLVLVNAKLPRVRAIGKQRLPYRLKRRRRRKPVPM